MAINTLYMDNGVLKSAAKTYSSQNPRNIRLENFFQKAVFSLLRDKLHSSQFSLKFHPYKYKYHTAKSKEIDSFIKGRYFKDLINKTLGIKKYEIKYEIKKFEPGDYTLLHDAEEERHGVDFAIDFSQGKEYFGGYTSYLTEKEELLTVIPKPNTLSFIERKNGIIKFTKYLTHQNRFPVLQSVGTLFSL